MNFKKTVKKIAQKEGIGTKAVYREMQRAIDLGYACTNPCVKMAWSKIDISRRGPRPEDVVRYAASVLKA